MTKPEQTSPAITSPAVQAQRGPVEIDAQLLKFVAGGVTESPKGGWNEPSNLEAESPKGGW